MDRLRHWLSLLTGAAVMVCTCAPWGARAEFGPSDSANLSAINSAVSGFANSLDNIDRTTAQNLPSLSTIKEELQTLRMSLCSSVPSMLQHLQAQTVSLSQIHSDTGDAAFYLYGIDQTLDDVADLLVNQPFRLSSIDTHAEDIGSSLDTAVSELSDCRFQIDAVDDSIGNVDDSVGEIIDGFGEDHGEEEDYGELPELTAADIDDEVKPFQDGQSIFDQGSGQFQNSWQSFITDVFSNLHLDFWGIEPFLGSFKSYLASAPNIITLAPAHNFGKFNIPDITIDWTPFKTSELLSWFRRFNAGVIYGLFGMSVFYRAACYV